MLSACAMSVLPLQQFTSHRSACTINARYFSRRQLTLSVIAPCEDNECGECACQPEYHEPPDMPDQSESAGDGKERTDETGRTVTRNLDRLIVRRSGQF